MTRRRGRRARFGWAATAATALALMLAIGRPGLSQMISGGAKDEPARPLPPGMKAPAIDFRDIAAEAGLTAVVVSGDTEQTSLIENTGTGVAIFDYDNDGLPDIFVVQGDRLKPGQAPGQAALTPHLYHNLGGLRFEDVTQKAGIGHLGWGQGVCAGDVDNDGYVDLFITQWGHNVFLHNLGNGTFRDETRARGLDRPGPRWSTGCAFIDYDRDGSLDLVVAHYVDFDSQPPPKPRERSGCNWKGIGVPCGPRGLKGETMTLYHNDGHGRFTDVTKQAGLQTPPDHYCFTVLTGDFDNDGWPDIYVACDSTPSLYFHNRHDGTFEEIGLLSGVAVNEDGREQAGMGATAGDYDGDGYLDIFKTNFSSDTNTLYRNLGNGSFADVTSRAGLAVHTGYVKWGTAFVDVTNDGRKDLFVAAGHVYPFVDRYGLGEEFRQPRQLYWNRGDGQFFDMSPAAGAGITARHSSRGIAVGDLDNDGSEEIVVVNLFEAPSLLKNFGPRGNALLVRALTASGRDAIGARVTVTSGGRKQIDEVRSGGYHISQGDFRVHFGLGPQPQADLAIRWPQGAVESFRDVAANQLIVVREGKGIVERRPFGQKRIPVSSMTRAMLSLRPAVPNMKPATPLGDFDQRVPQIGAVSAVAPQAQRRPEAGLERQRRDRDPGHRGQHDGPLFRVEFGEVQAAGLQQQVVQALAAQHQGRVLAQHRIDTLPGRRRLHLVHDSAVGRAFDQEFRPPQARDDAPLRQRRPGVRALRDRQAERRQPGRCLRPLATGATVPGGILDPENRSAALVADPEALHGAHVLALRPGRLVEREPVEQRIGSCRRAHAAILSGSWPISICWRWFCGS